MLQEMCQLDSCLCCKQEGRLHCEGEKAAWPLLHRPQPPPCPARWPRPNPPASQIHTHLACVSQIHTAIQIPCVFGIERMPNTHVWHTCVCQTCTIRTRHWANMAHNYIPWPRPHPAVGMGTPQAMSEGQIRKNLLLHDDVRPDILWRGPQLGNRKPHGTPG